MSRAGEEGCREFESPICLSFNCDSLARTLSQRHQKHVRVMENFIKECIRFSKFGHLRMCCPVLGDVSETHTVVEGVLLLLWRVLSNDQLNLQFVLIMSTGVCTPL